MMREKEMKEKEKKRKEKKKEENHTVCITSQVCGRQGK
jgi:hypothetical protein